MRMRRGNREFLVKWKGYSFNDNTWEAEENIAENCKDLIRTFLMIDKRGGKAKSDAIAAYSDPSVASSSRDQSMDIKYERAQLPAGKRERDQEMIGMMGPPAKLLKKSKYVH
jgi:chromobox protein 1